jgi:hypothetical protein
MVYIFLMTTPASSPELDDKKRVLLQSLLEFYGQHPNNLLALTRVLRESRDHEHKLSLRVLDWLCTNYSKSKAVTLSKGTNPFHVHIEYRNTLRGVSKRLFDPFARRQRIIITDIDGKPMETTLGQLNFMRWCIRHDVLQYAMENAKDIEEDMIACLRRRASSTPVEAKRRELSKNTLASGHVKRCRVTVTFK